MKKSSWEKAWYVLSPFLLYMVVKNIISILLVLFVRYLQENSAMVSMLTILENHNLCSAVINGVASLVGVSFIYRKFLDETTFRGEYDPDANVLKQTFMRLQTSIDVHKKKWLAFLLIPVFAGSSAIAMNMIMSLLPITSNEYDRVANVQYSVPIWLGILLYGMIAPVVEEIVFRGMLYHRMRRLFSPWIAMLATSFMFGVFHGNVVQMIYAMSLGILMILTYNWLSSFWGPVLFHMSANLVIYLCSTVFAGTILVSVTNCIIFTGIASLTGFGVYFLLKSMNMMHKQR